MRTLPKMAAMLGLVLLGGCGEKSTDSQAVEKPKAEASATKPLPPAKPVKIAELLRDPKAYAGKEVSVNGTFSGICCESDWFLKDGVDTIEVYSTKMCPMPSKSKVRSKVTVIGTVMVRGDQPAITSKEVRFQ